MLPASLLLREFSLLVRVYDHDVGDCCIRAHNLLNTVSMDTVGTEAKV